jgi:Carboxypeptidase regulatory-like domain/TonB dependent receptor-like, beta-barrel
LKRIGPWIRSAHKPIGIPWGKGNLFGFHSGVGKQPPGCCSIQRPNFGGGITMRLRNQVLLAALVVLLVLVATPYLTAQINTVNLRGTVLDPQGLAVKDAKVTLTNVANGAQRYTVTDLEGRYEFLGIPPGEYSLSVDAQGFAVLTNPSLKLELGKSPEYNPKLQVKATTETVQVEAAPELVETTKTDVSTSINQNQINNLPINGRNYINFTLLNSQAARDDTPSIGAAPTSGLNFGGQRGRSNNISVDGTDANDNSVGGVRATVSQEAVQEFQVITANYMPEYGRAMGGVVNIVSKSGTNAVHGNVFGYLRNGGIQARDPFSVTASCNPATLTCGINPVKQSYTRVQGGATIGGPIQKDKTFYFFSYEILRQQATGFTDIGADNFGFVPESYPAAGSPPPAGCNLSNGFVTPAQKAFLSNPATPAALGVPYFCLAAGASAVALFGNISINGIPVVPNSFPSSGATLPSTFQGLASVIGNFPTSNKGSIVSLRLDHIWNPKNSTFIRGMFSPDTFTGIQVNAQNQTFGQNAGNRTSDQNTHDWAIIAQHTTLIHDNLFNEARFQASRRSLNYTFSQLPGGNFPADNIAGFAFLGREPFTTENRIEKRFQWADNVTWTKGSHTIKFGGDFNLVKLGTNASQIFTLNYGGVFNFNSLSAGSLVPAFAAANAPSFSAVQAYGLGIPNVYYQGVGQSRQLFDNKVLGLFVQDSWKINRKLTLNYGLRYDSEWLPIFPPFYPAVNQAFGIVQGMPHDGNNVQPRIGIAWDPWGDGKTVIRAGYGFFYDHPALALAFLSTTEDGALSAQLETFGGAPSNADVSNPANIAALNASSIFQGILSSKTSLLGAPPITSCSLAAPTMCYGAPGIPFGGGPQVFGSTFPNSVFNQGRFLTVPGYVAPPGVGYPLPLLPFTIPVRSNFQYALAQQANLTIERELSKDWKISFGYNFTHGTHLDHTININVTDPALLMGNDSRAISAGLVTAEATPLGISVPSTGTPGGCGPGTLVNNTAGGGSVLIGAVGNPALVPGILGEGFSGPNCGGVPVGLITTPVIFNFFRPSGPNPSFSGLVPGGYATLVALAHAANLPTGFPGVQVPLSDVYPQSSNGNSVYHAFTLTMTKRLSHGFELLSGWTWSHAIDDSTDLSTLLAPQDNSFPQFDRGNSDFDQRHRWITSAVYQSPTASGDSSFWRKFLSNFTVAPIIEVSSGRPYNLLLGYDTNLDFGSSTGRPSFVKTSTPPPGSTVSPFIHGIAFTPPDRCIASDGTPFSFPDTIPFVGCTGTFGRNALARPGYFDIDLRIARKIPVNERVNVEVIADAFNILNRFNVSDVNPVCDSTASFPSPAVAQCAGGQPTAAYDPRTFQFALKVNF